MVGVGCPGSSVGVGCCVGLLVGTGCPGSTVGCGAVVGWGVPGLVGRLIGCPPRSFRIMLSRFMSSSRIVLLIPRTAPLPLFLCLFLCEATETTAFSHGLVVGAGEDGGIVLVG